MAGPTGLKMRPTSTVVRGSSNAATSNGAAEATKVRAPSQQRSVPRPVVRSASVGVRVSSNAVTLPGAAEATERRALSEPPVSRDPRNRSSYGNALVGAEGDYSMEHMQAHFSSVLTHKTPYFPENMVAQGSFALLLSPAVRVPQSHTVTIMTTTPGALKLVKHIIAESARDADDDPQAGFMDHVMLQSSKTAVTTITLIVPGFSPALEGASQSRDQVMACRLADMLLQINAGKTAVNAHNDWKGVVLYSSRGAYGAMGGAVVRCRFSDLVPPSVSQALLGASLILPGNKLGMNEPAPEDIKSVWVLSLYKNPAQPQMVEALVYMVADNIPTGQEMAQVMGYQYGETQYEARSAQRCLYGNVKRPEKLLVSVSTAASTMLMSAVPPTTPQRAADGSGRPGVATLQQELFTPQQSSRKPTMQQHARVQAWAKGVPAVTVLISPTNKRAKELENSFMADAPELIAKLCHVLQVESAAKAGRRVYRSLATAETTHGMDAVSEMARLREKTTVARGLFTTANAPDDEDDDGSVLSMVTVITGSHNAPVSSTSAPAGIVTPVIPDDVVLHSSNEVVDASAITAAATLALSMVGKQAYDEVDTNTAVSAAAMAMAEVVVREQMTNAIACVVKEKSAAALSTGHQLHWGELKMAGKKRLFKALLRTVSDGTLDTTTVNEYSESEFFAILTSMGTTDRYSTTIAVDDVLLAGWIRVTEGQFAQRKTIAQCRKLLPKDITFTFECARQNSNVPFKAMLTSNCLPDTNGATLADE